MTFIKFIKDLKERRKEQIKIKKCEEDSFYAIKIMKSTDKAGADSIYEKQESISNSENLRFDLRFHLRKCLARASSHS